MVLHRAPILSYVLSLFLLATVCVAEFHSIWPYFNGPGRNSQLTNNQAITDELKKDLGNDPSRLYISQSESLKFTWYWYADLTPELVEKYKTMDGVRHVAVPNNAGNSFRAVTTPPLAPVSASGSTNDPEAPRQLRILSLPEGKSFVDSKGYKYDSSAGKGVNIYVLDSGLTQSSPEFESREVSWIFAGPFASNDETDADVGGDGAPPNQQGHGTCMASIALGNKYGVARAASLTVVRSDVFSSELKREASAEIWIDGLAKIYDDIAQKSDDFKAIVSISIGVTRNADQNYEACYADAFKEILEKLDEKDIVQAVSVGNDGTEIHSYPALLVKSFKDRKARLPSLVAVGGFDIRNGDFENDIRDPEIKIYGPADDAVKGAADPGLLCASRDGIGYHDRERGTSHATAAVSGLLATFMSQGKTGAEARQALFDAGIVRKKNGPKTANNGLDGTTADVECCKGDPAT